MTFIAEKCEVGHWTCHKEGQPELTFGGAVPTEAFRRCCRGYGMDAVPFTTIGEQIHGRVIFTEPATCPDCRGAGQYIGLHIVETCGKCGGKGRSAS